MVLVFLMRVMVDVRVRGRFIKFSGLMKRVVVFRIRRIGVILGFLVR